ncbi:MAG TPA: hypothetical protein VF582_09195 [Allosphingosinicella sp.]|jgi:hypothetical protein
MAQDPAVLIALASCGVIGFSVASAAALKGWTAWLDLKRSEMDAGPSPSRSEPLSRIEVSELKDRVRKLEAIASGADY